MKFAEPAYASFRAADIPEIQHAGAKVRVIAGKVDGVEGPMKNATPMIFAHIQLDAGASVTLSVDETVELGLYVLDGRIEGNARAPIGPGELAVLGSGAQLTLTATADQRADVALLGGAPVEGALVFAGPFVMDTPERVEKAKRDFASGRMGRLDGVPF